MLHVTIYNFTILQFTIYYLLFTMYNVQFAMWRILRSQIVNSKSSNRTSLEFFQEVCDAFHILYSRYRLETAVDIDTCEIGVAELPEGFYAVGVDATAEQERGGTVVAVQEVPVELVSKR